MYKCKENAIGSDDSKSWRIGIIELHIHEPRFGRNIEINITTPFHEFVLKKKNWRESHGFVL